MLQGSGIVYIGLNNDQYSLVQDDTYEEGYDKIHSLSLTRPLARSTITPLSPITITLSMG